MAKTFQRKVQLGFAKVSGLIGKIVDKSQLIADQNSVIRPFFADHIQHHNSHSGVRPV